MTKPSRASCTMLVASFMIRVAMADARESERRCAEIATPLGLTYCAGLDGKVGSGKTRN